MLPRGPEVGGGGGKTKMKKMLKTGNTKSLHPAINAHRTICAHRHMLALVRRAKGRRKSKERKVICNFCV